MKAYLSEMLPRAPEFLLTLFLFTCVSALLHLRALAVLPVDNASEKKKAQQKTDFYIGLAGGAAAFRFFLLLCLA
ncbi:MAG: hypothetical protein LBN05_08380 [Oscillospiraceae bacterium]|nr:hypothetical protein [Oscillospiraceae bacterium]